MSNNQQLNVKQFWRGRCVLITGCTGFLGKVILEKLLRSCSDIDKIFVMVRPKRKVDPMQRVKDSIIASQCFQQLRHLYGNDQFVAFAESKIIPISGDLTLEHLGISPQERKMITENVDVIINSAASVNFDDPLHDAIKINYYGSERILQLAKECVNLKVLTHVSTAYVNCNRTGRIEEQIYGTTDDVQKTVQNIMSKSVKELEDNLQSYIGVFPNTYTFTKNLSEKNLMQNRGNVKLIIWRPSIITSAFNQPFPGWTDSVSAAGGLTLLTGLGLLQNVSGDGAAPFDIIPVDYVSNGILVATAYAHQQPDYAEVFNCASTVCNQISLKRYRDIGVDVWQKIKLYDAVGKAKVNFNHTEFEFQIKRYLFTIWPVQLFSYAANLPIIGSQKMRENALQLSKAVNRIDGMLEIFKFFMDGGWLYENSKFNTIIDCLSPQERVEFECDIRDVEYEKLIKDYITGISIWFLKEDRIAPDQEMDQVLYQDKYLFDDVNRTLQHQTNFIEKNSQDYEKSILVKERFQKFVQGSKSEITKGVSSEFNYKQVSYDLYLYRTALQKKDSQALFYFMNKTATRLLDGLHIDMKGLQRIKKMTEEDRKTKVVLMPMFKSYSDLFILHYANWISDIEMGFSFGYYNDSPKVKMIERLARRVGYFMLKPNTSQRINYVNQTMIEEVIGKNSITTCFQNEIRPRNGKIKKPFYPDYMVKNVLKAYTNLKQHTNKIKIIPVCVNYERLFDASYLADEAKLGTFKPGTTLVSLMSKIMTMKKGQMGKVFVKYGDAIDIHDYVNNYIETNHSNPDSKVDFKKLSMRLTEDLYIKQIQEQPITQNSLIASSILFHKKKEISFKHIKTACSNMWKHIQNNRYKTYCSNEPKNFDINRAVKHLGFRVSGDPLSRNKGDSAIVHLDGKYEALKSLSLSYYSNQLSVNFQMESIISCSCNYLFKQYKSEPIPIAKLLETCEFIHNIFLNEFILLKGDKFDQQEVMGLLKVAKDLKMLKVDLDRGVVERSDEGHGSQRDQFIHSLLASYIDTYLIVAETLYSIMELGITIEQNKLVSQLHESIQALYYKGQVRFINSCLPEIIETAFGRFSELEICHQQIFDSHVGEKIVYISCKKAKQDVLNEYMKILFQLSTPGQKRDSRKDLEREIDKAIEVSQGPMARL